MGHDATILRPSGAKKERRSGSSDRPSFLLLFQDGYLAQVVEIVVDHPMEQGVEAIRPPRGNSMSENYLGAPFYPKKKGAIFSLLFIRTGGNCLKSASECASESRLLLYLSRGGVRHFEIEIGF